jgi:hypothetical protein
MIFNKVGAWKSFDELEENMSLPEIMASVEELYDADWLDKRFLAGLNGIDLDDNRDPNTPSEQEVLERIVARANAVLSGADPDDTVAVSRQKFAQIGIDYEVI